MSEIKIRPTELTEDQKLAQRLKAMEIDRQLKVSPNLSEAERNQAAQRLLERTVNPGNKLDIEMGKK